MTIQQTTTAKSTASKFSLLMALMQKFHEATKRHEERFGKKAYREDVGKSVKEIRDFEKEVREVKWAVIRPLVDQADKLEAQILSRQHEVPKLQHELHLLNSKRPKIVASIGHVRSQLHLDKVPVSAAVVGKLPTRRERLAQLQQELAQLDQEIANKAFALEDAQTPKTAYSKGQVTRLKNLDAKIVDLWARRDAATLRFDEMMKKIRSVIGWIERNTEEDRKTIVPEIVTAPVAAGSQPALNPALAEVIEREGLDPSDPEDIELAKLFVPTLAMSVQSAAA